MNSIRELLIMFYIAFQIIAMILCLIGIGVDYSDNSYMNVASRYLTSKNIYNGTQLNIGTCKFLSILGNLVCPMWNITLAVSMIFYWITHKGREGNFGEEPKGDCKELTELDFKKHKDLFY